MFRTDSARHEIYTSSCSGTEAERWRALMVCGPVLSHSCSPRPYNFSYIVSTDFLRNGNRSDHGGSAVSLGNGATSLPDP
jgi:hypothetical protein